MSSPIANPSASAATRLRRRRRNKMPSHSENRRAAYLVLAIAGIFISAIIYSRGGIEGLIRILYSPVSILVLFFLILEYVLLKGRDRSRLYKIELERLRDRHREEMNFIARSQDRLEKIHDQLGKLSARMPGEENGSIKEISQEVAQMEKEFSERQTLGPVGLNKKDND